MVIYYDWKITDHFGCLVGGGPSPDPPVMNGQIRIDSGSIQYGSMAVPRSGRRNWTVWMSWTYAGRVASTVCDKCVHDGQKLDPHALPHTRSIPLQDGDCLAGSREDVAVRRILASDFKL